MACSSTSDCYLKDSTGLYTGISCSTCNCTTMEDGCICANGGCTKTVCTDDSYCQQTFGDKAKCINGYCTKSCETTDDCPPLMQCNGGKCTSLLCNKNSDCGSWAECYNGRCVRKIPPNQFIFIILFIIIVVLLVITFPAFYYVKFHKKN